MPALFRNKVPVLKNDVYHYFSRYHPAPKLKITIGQLGLLLSLTLFVEKDTLRSIREIFPDVSITIIIVVILSLCAIAVS